MVGLSKKPLVKKRGALPDVKNFVIVLLESEKKSRSVFDPFGSKLRPVRD